MNNKQNLHTHTIYADGKDAPEEMILAAMEKGFDSIGFSEHSYLPDSLVSDQLTIDDMVRYKKEINDLKQKYKGQIDVFCGLEYDFYSDVPTEGLDYLIGSVHYLDFGGEKATFDWDMMGVLAYMDTHFGGDAMAFAKAYFATVARLPERCSFDIIGHFDLIAKNNEKGKFLDVSFKEYLDLGFEAIHALKGKIPFFEVNTGAISRGYRTAPYPQMDFLKEFNRLGFGAVITSDCHNKGFLDCAFDDAAALLAEAGFTTKWVLTHDGFREVPLF